MQKTGNWRFRVHKPLFKQQIVILQLEWEYTTFQLEYDLYRERVRTKWLDATSEDLLDPQSLSTLKNFRLEKSKNV